MNRVPPIEAGGPRVVGRYLLHGEIASGGMATVHFGRLIGPAGFARPVAIKKLHPQFARDPEFVKMFYDEARLAACIAHPNVVPTLDVFAEGDEVFLVMEYVRGVSLAQLARMGRVAGARMPANIGLAVVGGMLQGLHAAHEARNDRGEPLELVHRDVSPQNVLVGIDGIARLLDFGVAKAAGRLQTTREGQLKGKLAYMAPEQVHGAALTRRADIYGASVVLWEVLTGRRLFVADNEAHVLARVLSAEVPRPSSIVAELPEGLDRIVLRGLQRDPERRYASARDMASDLMAFSGFASPGEIGDWVEQTAAKELSLRASHIAEFERSAVEVSEELMIERLSGRDAAEAPTRVARRINEIATVSFRKPSTATDGGGDEPQASIRSRAGWFVRTRSLRASVSVVVACAAAVVIVSVAHFRTRPTRETAVQPSLPGVIALATPARATTAIAERPSEPEDLAPEPAAPPGPSRPAKESAKETVEAARRPSVRPSSAIPGNAAADCTPPYTADPKGHIHFKPNCL
jgi:serine/threonine protein kinase